MKNAVEIFMYLDVIIVMWALHKLYHSMFDVIYFSIGSYLKELLAVGIIAGLLVTGPSSHFKTTSTQLLYYAGIFIVAMIIIFRPKKAKESKVDNNTSRPK